MGFNMKARMVTIGKLPEQTHSLVKAKIAERTPSLVTQEIVDLVKEDIKKGKLGNEEQYVQKCIFDIKKHQMAVNMIKKADMTFEDVSELIRATIKAG